MPQIPNEHLIELGIMVAALFEAHEQGKAMMADMPVDGHATAVATFELAGKNYQLILQEAGEEEEDLIPTVTFN